MLKRNKNNEERIEVESCSLIRNMAIGYDDTTFAIAINQNEDNSYEGVFFVQADKWQEIVAMLFEAGVHYQKDTGIDIGFGMGEDYDN